MNVVFHIKVTDFGNGRVVVLEVEVVGIGESQCGDYHAADKYAVCDQSNVFIIWEPTAQITDDAVCAGEIHMQIVIFLRQSRTAAGGSRYCVGESGRADF